MVRAGLLRLAVVFLLVCMAVSLLSLAVGALVGYPERRAVPVGLELAGCFLMVIGFFAGNRGPLRLRSDERAHPSERGARWLSPGERTERINESALFVCVGLLLVLLGLVADPHIRLV